MMSIQLRSRDKLVIGGALAILSVAAWISMLYQSQTMNMDHTHEHMVGMGANFPGLALLLYISTWTVMMTAMMLPSAGPMIMTYAAVSQQRRSSRPAQAHTALFALGYLLAWGGSGLAAYAISTLLPMMAQLVPQLEKYSGFIGGAVLIMAGAYQFSSLKNLCLSTCRTPLGYILTHWREGHGGALRMGLHHGFYCVGCCWALMSVLFVVGIMNLAWMAALALVTFVEKVSRRGVILSKAVGIALVIAGVMVAFYSLP